MTHLEKVLKLFTEIGVPFSACFASPSGAGYHIDEPKECAVEVWVAGAVSCFDDKGKLLGVLEDETGTFNPAVRSMTVPDTNRRWVVSSLSGCIGESRNRKWAIVDDDGGFSICFCYSKDDAEKIAGVLNGLHSRKDEPKT